MSEALVLPDPLASRAIAPPAFVCSWTAGGPDAAWVHVVGELVLATAARLEQTLLQPQLDAGLVVLDLRELAFIDSSGVHSIVNASTRDRRVGRRLVVLRGPLNVNRISSCSGVLLRSRSATSTRWRRSERGWHSPERTLLHERHRRLGCSHAVGPDRA